MTPPDPSYLRQIPLFHGLSDAEHSRLASLLRRRAVPANTSIYTVDAPGDSVCIILSGTVKIHVEQAGGTDVILAILGPNQTVGEMSPVDSLARSATVETLEPTSLLWMSRASFQACLSSMPRMAVNLVRILSQRLRLANAQIQALAALDVPGRVARQVLAFAEEYGAPAAGGGTLIPLRLTQTDLADIVGASRVSVNHALMEYRQRGYLSIDSKHRITVHDADALAACFE
jgi:CRP/FNR family cyclic AMP-dependent transcriptional regulator